MQFEFITFRSNRFYDLNKLGELTRHNIVIISTKLLSANDVCLTEI